MNILKELRQKKGLYQKDVAEYLGVDRTTYVKWEKGNTEPNQDALIKLADYFGVTTDYLMGRENRPVNNEPVRELTENVIIYHRNGITVEKKFTKEEMEILTTMIDSLKGVQNDEDL